MISTILSILIACQEEQILKQPEICQPNPIKPKDNSINYQHT